MTSAGSLVVPRLRGVGRLANPATLAGSVLMVILLLAGCSSIGPGRMTEDRFDYTAAVGESWKSQMLLNLVKIRYGDAPVFLDIGHLIASNAQNAQHRRLIVDLAAKHKLADFYPNVGWIDDGGLLSYGAAGGPHYYRAAAYVDKIFKGAEPGMLPIEQPTRFQLEINLRTAKALGVTIPQSLLLRADRIIE